MTEVSINEVKINIAGQLEKMGEEKMDKNAKKQYDDLSNVLKCVFNDLIKADGLNPHNIMFVVTNMMSVAGAYKNLSGPQKKELIVFILCEFIREEVDDPIIEANLTLMIQTIVPGTIDIIIDVSKNVYKFDNKTFLDCIKKYICCKK
jgi:hypothetical protein